MPAELPGYYFDANTNRYYKIQANHIAPTGSNYSRQAVNAEKVIKTTQRREALRQVSKHASTVTRATALQNPLLAFDRRLGNLQTTTRSYVREYYAASLCGADALSKPISMPRVLGQHYQPIGLSEQFAVEESTQSLLTSLLYQAPGSRTFSLLLAFDRRNRRSSPTAFDYLDPERDLAWPTPREEAAFNGYLYSPHHKRILQTAPKVDCMTWAGPDLVCYAHETHDNNNNNNDAGAAAAGNSYRSDLLICHYADPDRATGLDVMITLRFQARIMDFATSPSRESLAIATSSGVSVMTDLAYAQRVTSTAIHGEQMKVGFKDEHVLMSGSRSGKLMFCDTRSSSSETSTSTSTSSASWANNRPQSKASAALRIQHSSAISGIAALPDGNRVLVNGLTDMKIYDLRFVTAPTPNRDPQYYKQYIRHHAYIPSTPVVSFNIPPTRRQNRYGLGFAYDPELDLVVSTSTDNYHNHRVGLWSAATGQLLDSPLNEHRFKEPVTCAGVARLRDGPKSILLASAGKVEEWCAQGRGFETEQE